MTEEEQIPVTINLQDFITEALVQITEGVKEAQARVEESGAKINPVNSIFQDGAYRHMPNGSYSTNEVYGQNIEFDVAVTATDKGSIKGGIGVVSSWINLGYTAEKGNELGSITRIKFSIPLFLPLQGVMKSPHIPDQPTDEQKWKDFSYTP